jgi:hypothetical protein
VSEHDEMPESLGEPSWTQTDVEVAAQAACDGLIPPLELMMRLGPNPPREYLAALGARVVQMAEARKLLLSQIVVQQEAMIEMAKDYVALSERNDGFAGIDEILGRPE